MMCEKVTAELRADGTVVLTIPEEDSSNIMLAFHCGATCSRAISDNAKLPKGSRDIALEVAECLKKLSDIFERAYGVNPPKRPKLRLVQSRPNKTTG